MPPCMHATHSPSDPQSHHQTASPTTVGSLKQHPPIHPPTHPPRCVGAAAPHTPHGAPWFCPECAAGQMRCFVCEGFGASTADLSVRKCSLGACGRFFHLACASRLPLCNLAASGTFFRCPQHYCATCGKRCAGALRRGAVPCASAVLCASDMLCWC